MDRAHARGEGHWGVGMDEQEWLPKLDYYLDESDPNVVVLRRQDGTIVAAFSAQGATREGILAAAYVDYRKLASRLHAGAERASFLEELPEHAAVVEGSGTIVAANRAWKRFPRTTGPTRRRFRRGPTTWAFAMRLRASSPSTPDTSPRGFVRSCRAKKSASPWNILATRLPKGAGSWGAWPKATHP